MDDRRESHSELMPDVVPGSLVRVNGREAVVLYARHSGAVVIRYRGDRQSRVVPSRKVSPAPDH